MPWANEERFKRGKRTWHTTDMGVHGAGRYRITSSVAPLHYESVLDSGDFDTEVDLSPQRVNTANLNGWRVTANGYHFAYQGFAQSQNQPPQGTVAYGGRQGQHWMGLRPFRVGYLHWPTRAFTAIGGAPTFSTPTLDIGSKTFGIDDADPSTWNLTTNFDATVSDLWSAPGGASIDWIIKVGSGKLKQNFVINQAMRDWITANAPPTTPVAQTWFGVVFRIEWRDIPRIRVGGVLRDLQDDDFEFSQMNLEDLSGRALGFFQEGEIYVKGRGGFVPIRHRIYFDGTDWFYMVGANVQQMVQNLLPGDLVIDPPITEESITANADDAGQGASAGQEIMTLDGFSSRQLFGDATNLYHNGWRFQTVPIGNGDTINSATLEPRVNNSQTGSGITANLFGHDVDDAATFTTNDNDITGRVRTTASTALSGTTAATGFPVATNRCAWDVSGQVAEITSRGGWASNNDMAFVCIITSNVTSYGYFNDYLGGAANAADFNADVDAAGGGRIMSSLANHGGLAGMGGIAGQGGGLAG